MKEKNPIDSVRFYRKNAQNKAVWIPQNQVRTEGQAQTSNLRTGFRLFMFNSSQ